MIRVIRRYEVTVVTGKQHGSLARAGKVRGQTPKVEKQDKKKKKTGRAKRRIQYIRRFVNAVGGQVSVLLVDFKVSNMNRSLPRRAPTASPLSRCVLASSARIRNFAYDLFDKHARKVRDGLVEVQKLPGCAAGGAAALRPRQHRDNADEVSSTHAKR